MVFSSDKRVSEGAKLTIQPASEYADGSFLFLSTTCPGVHRTVEKPSIPARLNLQCNTDITLHVVIFLGLGHIVNRNVRCSGKHWIPFDKMGKVKRHCVFVFLSSLVASASSSFVQFGVDGRGWFGVRLLNPSVDTDSQDCLPLCRPQHHVAVGGGGGGSLCWGCVWELCLEREAQGLKVMKRYWFYRYPASVDHFS